MKDLSFLIPENKFDFRIVDEFNNYTIVELKSILPALFEWIEDINWAIAQKLIDLLPVFEDDLVPLISKSLQSNDDVTQFSCFMLIRKLNKKIIVQIKDDLLRIANHPTNNEISAEINKDAIEVLKENNLI